MYKCSPGWTSDCTTPRSPSSPQPHTLPVPSSLPGFAWAAAVGCGGGLSLGVACPRLGALVFSELLLCLLQTGFLSFIFIPFLHCFIILCPIHFYLVSTLPKCFFVLFFYSRSLLVVYFFFFWSFLHFIFYVNRLFTFFCFCLKMEHICSILFWFSILNIAVCNVRRRQ